MLIRLLLVFITLLSISAFSQEVVRIRRSWVQISDPKDTLRINDHYYLLDREGNRTAIVRISERLGMSVGTQLISGKVERGFKVDATGSPSQENLQEFGSAMVLSGKNNEQVSKVASGVPDSLSSKKIARGRRISEYASWVWSVYPLDVLILRFEAEIEKRIAPRFAIGPHGVYSRISIAGLTAEYHEIGVQGLMKFSGNWGDPGFCGGFGVGYAQFSGKLDFLGQVSETAFGGLITYGRLFYQWAGQKSNLRLGARYTLPMLKETKAPTSGDADSYVLASRIGIDFTVGWNF